jgi:hypothetical protein
VFFPHLLNLDCLSVKSKVGPGFTGCAARQRSAVKNKYTQFQGRMSKREPASHSDPRDGANTKRETKYDAEGKMDEYIKFTQKRYVLFWHVSWCSLWCARVPRLCILFQN